jgi:hypothetical protein
LAADRRDPLQRSNRQWLISAELGTIKALGEPTWLAVTRSHCIKRKIETNAARKLKRALDHTYQLGSMNLARYVLFSVTLIVFLATLGVAQTPLPNSPSSSPQPLPCPKSSQSGPTGNAASNPASHQGVEHSAILPEAGGTDESAAPTIKKDGQEVDATECPKPPNQLNVPGTAK